MKKFLILTSVLLVITIFLAVKYFSNLSLGSRKSDQVLSQIPADAALVFEFTNDRSFYEIFNEYPLFGYVLGESEQQRLEGIRNLLQQNRIFAELLNHQKIYVSLHHEKDRHNLLWVSSLNEPVPERKLSRALAESAKAIRKGDFYELTLPNATAPFYLMVRETLIAGSFSKTLLQTVANTREPKISENFIGEINAGTAGSRNSILNLYINHQNVLPYLNKFYRDKLSGNYILFNNLTGFSTLNMNFKSDAMIFNGLTNSDTTRQTYVNIFLHQRPSKGTLNRVLPVSTANSLQFNLSNYSLFERDLRKVFRARKETESLVKQINEITTETGINPERDIRNLWASEFNTFQTANHERYGIVQVKDGRKLNFLLEPLSKEVTAEIRKLSYSNLFYFYFGDPFRSFKRPYYFITDNHLVFCNSLSALKTYLDDYKRDQFLYKTPRYVAFEQLMSNQSSISLFIHNSNSKSISRSTLKQPFGAKFTAPDSPLKNFYGLSYQWSSDDGHFFTNLYLGTVKEEQADISTDSLIHLSDRSE